MRSFLKEQHFLSFCILFLIFTATPFQVNCTAVPLDGSSCVNITCEEAEGSQSIVGVEVFLNEESQGPGKSVHVHSCSAI